MKARVHYCFSQHLNEVMPPTRCSAGCDKNRSTGKRCICKKCKCRKRVSIAEATRMVKAGEAEWVTLTKEAFTYTEACKICLNDAVLKKSCSNCNKLGELKVTRFRSVPGKDIVMVTMGGGEEESQTFRPVMSKQTPRVATIEKTHIERAYIFDKESAESTKRAKEEAERIEVYGQMTVELFESLIVPFQQDAWEGRAVLTFGADNRSVSSDWSQHGQSNRKTEFTASD